MNLFDFFKFFSLAHSEIAENGAGKVLSSEEENSSVHKTYVNFLTSRKSALNVPLYAISSGRSMVEMLGVLAIIGVLSVGAISGYSKAMMKYKLNKQTEQINQIMMTMVEYKSVFANAGYNESLIPLFVKLNALPTEMIHSNSNSNTYIYDIFGLRIDIMRMPDPDYMYLVFHMTNFADANHTVCRNILESFKGYAAELAAIGVNSTTSEDMNQQEWWYGDSSPDNYKKIHQLDISTMNSLCEKCDNYTCVIAAVFPL